MNRPKPTEPLDRALKVTFDQVAAEYDAVRPTYPVECIDDIIRFSGIRPSSKILELGCGTGQATSFFLERGFSVHCIDIGAALIEIARSKFKTFPGARFELASFEEAEFQDSSQDLIFSATAFHWIDPSVRYAKTAKVLKPGGTLALLWNIDTRGFSAKMAAMREAIDALYREAAPGEPTDAQRQSDFRNASETILGEIHASRLFSSVEVRRRPWQIEFSRERYLRLLDTFSYHRALDPPVRKRLISGIGEVIDANGGKIGIEYENVVLLAKNDVR